METKKIVECMRRCERITGRSDCDGCDYLFFGVLDCFHVLSKDAAKRLEELGKENEAMMKQLCEHQPEWISVEDEPIPGEQSHIFTVLPKIIIKRNHVTGEPAYWMRLESPKPKEPTFKDVFLEKFPKANRTFFEDCCPKSIFEPIKCPLPKFCAETDKKQCWNQPYFEEEGEGE